MLPIQPLNFLEGEHVSPKQTSSEENTSRFQSRFTQICRAGPEKEESGPG
jgi:hypothetical protein